jgi:hypothetical protein
MTDQGLFGVDLPFTDGLFILRAENSMGKSTCLRAILVALGMEAMLTANRDDLPLPPVLKEDLHTGDGHASVIESDIFLEIENSQGERVVVHRTVKGTRDTALIEVIRGPALTSTGRYRSDDYFVGRPGDTTRDVGFLRFLIDFLGWDVPTVRTFQGDSRPLYPQCIMPYVFVEQLRGWSTLEPPLPTRFGIKEMHRRAVEYLLGLDAIDLAAKRLEIEEQEQAITKQWSTVVGSLRAVARGIGGMPQNIPADPVATWPPVIMPIIMVPRDDQWIPLNEWQTQLERRLQEIEQQEIPRVAEIVGNAEAELASKQDRLNDRQAMLSRLLEVYELESNEVTGTQARLDKIEVDLQRNKDTRTLLTLGGNAASSVAQQQCPTCHQHIIDSLTPLAEGQGVMSIDENIAFLEEQRRTFRAVLANQEHVVEARSQQVIALRQEVSDLRGEIRSLKETLISDGRVPSVAAVRERVQLREGLERYARADDEFSAELESVAELSARWASLQAAKSKLPKEDTSTGDRQKIARWGELLREQLIEYDFKSLEVTEVTVSEESYRPLHEGFDLPTNISASDFIRVIWSYLNGLREVGLDFETNHPGLLVFDEPRQQSAKDLSFEQLLKRVARAGDQGHQVIFATSEKEDTLKKMLSDVPHSYHACEGYLISRIPST